MSFRETYTNEYHHIYNRGVDKRKIFQDQDDYERFWDSLNIFNDSTDRSQESFKRRKEKKLPKNPFVDVCAVTLIPNHYHLLLKQKIDGGISEFMKKVGLGYTHYFNQKNNRKGRLFEGPFDSKVIDSEAYLLHISRYIHLNILDLCGIDWKMDGIPKHKQKEAINFMSQYPWSSFPFYIGCEKSEFIIPEEILLLFNNPEDYKSYLFEYQPM